MADLRPLQAALDAYSEVRAAREGRVFTNAFHRKAMKAALSAAFATALGSRVVLDLPEDWRDQLHALEKDEYQSATEAGMRPSTEARAAFEAGLEAAAEWFAGRLAAEGEDHR